MAAIGIDRPVWVVGGGCAWVEHQTNQHHTTCAPLGCGWWWWLSYGMVAGVSSTISPLGLPVGGPGGVGLEAGPGEHVI